MSRDGGNGCPTTRHHHQHYGSRFDRMDNPKRLSSPAKACNARSANETELGELKVEPHEVQVVQGVPCHNGACKSSPVKGRPEHRLESPWHHLKTLFLVSMIIALIIWIIVYVLLNQYNVL
ncbi:hypothetical protein TSAR_009876 [Trichomalopsis sarcophagae]|uniref:Uncharacterized protein n=1 Tax=Trichomalopsis sarcophagae TaxID=543379 RepID=A0A232FKJ1_9HYME|nr:hypothetical protein TSAR_009876 [Trichomalopsis sarcophagae]